MAVLDVHDGHKIGIKYRALLNSVIAFEMQYRVEGLAAEIKAATEHLEKLKSIDKLLKSTPDAPLDYVSRMLRWINRNGEAKAAGEAKAILALETGHRTHEI